MIIIKDVVSNIKDYVFIILKSILQNSEMKVSEQYFQNYYEKNCNQTSSNFLYYILV